MFVADKGVAAVMGWWEGGVWLVGRFANRPYVRLDGCMDGEGWVLRWWGRAAPGTYPALLSVLWASLARAPFALRKGRTPFALRTFPPVDTGGLCSKKAVCSNNPDSVPKVESPTPKTASVPTRSGDRSA